MAVTWTARTIGLVSSLVRTIASVIGGLILVHAVFVLFGANPSNVLVQFTAGIRDSFGWFTKNLFQPSDHKMGEAINDALAGFIWVFLGSLLAKFIARLAPTSSGKDKSSKKQKDDTPRSTPVQKSRPAEQPKQEAPKQEAPKQEAVQEEAPAPAREPEPEPERESAPESEARHQARQTARDDEPAEA
jgi:hypothetical protein